MPVQPRNPRGPNGKVLQIREAGREIPPQAANAKVSGCSLESHSIRIVKIKMQMPELHLLFSPSLSEGIPHWHALAVSLRQPRSVAAKEQEGRRLRPPVPSASVGR